MRLFVTTILAAVMMSGLIQSAGARTMNGFDLSDATIPISSMEAGGPPRDGIPAINEPKFLEADQVDFLKGDDRLLGVQINGRARAYPISILNWHEVVNDRVGSQHFVVTYCPLCGTGMVFAANIADTALTFGVSGLLYNSDVLLFDRNSESLWSQILGEAVSGPLAGAPLPQLPARHTTWDDWRERHPRTQVLSTDTGFRRDYGASPYRGYERSRRLYFSVANQAPRDYHPKALVMGLEVDGVHKAYPFEELEKRGASRFSDMVNGERIEVFWNQDSSSAWAETSAGDELPTTTGFWFAWYAFYPETAVFKAVGSP